MTHRESAKVQDVNTPPETRLRVAQELAGCRSRNQECKSYIHIYKHLRGLGALHGISIRCVSSFSPVWDVTHRDLRSVVENRCFVLWCQELGQDYRHDHTELHPEVRRWHTAAVRLSENRQLSQLFSLQSGYSQNIASNASPTARNFFYFFLCLPGLFFSFLVFFFFLPVIFYYQVTRVLRSEIFYLWFDDFYFALKLHSP